MKWNNRKFFFNHYFSQRGQRGQRGHPVSMRVPSVPARKITAGTAGTSSNGAGSGVLREPKKALFRDKYQELGQYDPGKAWHFTPFILGFTFWEPWPGPVLLLSCKSLPVSRIHALF
jgi:hypothetical protein